MIVLVTNLNSLGQSVNKILENGKLIKRQEKIFLEYNNGKLFYDYGKVPVDFNPLTDSSIFLIDNTSVNIWIKSLNPLKFNNKFNIIEIEDIIESNYNEAFGKLIKGLSSLLPPPAAAPPAPVTPTPEQLACDNYTDYLIKGVKKINNLLDNNNNKNVNSIFNKLSSLTFNHSISTDTSLINQNIKTLIKQNENIKLRIQSLRDSINIFSCSPSLKFQEFTVKTLVTNILSEAELERIVQEKRFKNLNKLSLLVRTTIETANKIGASEQLYTPLEPVTAIRGKVKYAVIEISKGGFKLNNTDIEKAEIVQAEETDKITSILVIRKFFRFIPDVSAGVAFTDITFPKFGTAVDANGRTIIADAGEEKLRKVNVSAMINFNYFAPDIRPLYPFAQLGLGTNFDYPTFFTGGGINIDRRIALSGGWASTWVKQLNELKIGDPVPGTADLEKDITQEFNWFKPYFSIQLKF
ncbi:hypothetical protein GCM10011405_28890 [Rufibacter glacialis]|nr:hypothetical protein GCM10011405_28890 [Rufibacter glacialis]